jgi:hypothetical protein
MDNVDFAFKIAQLKADQKFLPELHDLTRMTYSLYAESLKKYYDALINVGFSNKEAIEIVARQGCIPK